MPIYNRGDAAWLRTGVTARIVYGYILPTVNVNSAQIGANDTTWLWCNLRSQLVCRISYRQVISRQPHIILRWKNVWMCTNLLQKNVNDVDFDANMSIDMCMKVMFLFIDIKLRVVGKYIYLYHAYCYLYHLCAWWCRCICKRICKCICRWICRWIWYITLVIYHSIDICMCKW